MSCQSPGGSLGVEKLCSSSSHPLQMCVLGEGSVWPFVSLVHVLGVLEVPALLATLPKPLMRF